MLTLLCGQAVSAQKSARKFVFADEFKGASGSPVDPTKRTMQTGRKVGPKPRPQRALAWTSPKYRISCVAGFPENNWAIQLVKPQCWGTWDRLITSRGITWTLWRQIRRRFVCGRPREKLKDRPDRSQISVRSIQAWVNFRRH